MFRLIFVKISLFFFFFTYHEFLVTNRVRIMGGPDPPNYTLNLPKVSQNKLGGGGGGAIYICVEMWIVYIMFQSPQKFGKFANKTYNLAKRIATAFARGGNHSSSRQRERFPWRPRRGTSTKQVGQLSFLSLCSAFRLYIESILPKKFYLDGLCQGGEKTD